MENRGLRNHWRISQARGRQKAGGQPKEEVVWRAGSGETERMIFFLSQRIGKIVNSAIKKDEIMPFVAPWMDLEIIILSEVSQKEKDKYI